MEQIASEGRREAVLTGGMIFVCIIFPGIGLISSLVYVIKGYRLKALEALIFSSIPAILWHLAAQSFRVSP